MIPAPLPYDPRWTAKLLRRDMRNLKNRAMTKLKARLVPTSQNTSTASGSTVDDVKVEPTVPKFVESTPKVAQNKHTATLYELLEDHLKTTWAARDRDISYKERWQFRGGWLVLCMAIQACPSNPSYDIFEGPKADETAISLDLARITASNTSPITHRVRKMPAAPFEGSNAHSRPRIDSVWDSDRPGANNDSKPTVPELWYIILEGATDVNKTASAAKELLSCVWPGDSADMLLDIIGDPAKSFARDDRLRSDIQNLLFPF